MRYAYSDGSYEEKNKLYKYGWIEDSGFKFVETASADQYPKPYSAHYAEYLGVLSFIPSHMDEPWELRVDSNLLFYQVTGKWKVKSPALKDIHILTKELIRDNDITLKLINTRENLADRILRKI